jgi:hypothetical protein
MLCAQAARSVPGAAGPGLGPVRAGGWPLLELWRLPGQDPAGQPPGGPAPLHTFPQATLPGLCVYECVSRSQGCGSAWIRIQLVAWI